MPVSPPSPPPKCSFGCDDPAVGWFYFTSEPNYCKRTWVCKACYPYRIQPGRSCKEERNDHIRLW